MQFRIGRQVIVMDHGKKKLGIIIGQYTKHKNRVYNVRMEDGVEHFYIKADNLKSNYWINTELSKKIAPTVQTNLSVNTQANYKKIDL